MKRIIASAARYLPGSVVFPCFLLGTSPAGKVPGVVLALNDLRAWEGNWPAYVTRTQQGIDAFVNECLSRGSLYQIYPVYFGKGRVEWVERGRLMRYSEALSEQRFLQPLLSRAA